MSAQTIFKSLFAFFIFSIVLSCSKESNNSNGNNSSPTGSRDVTYELTGTASGEFSNISAIYFTATGDSESQNAIVLPWSKDVTIDNNVPAITFQAVVSNATAGQTITAKIIVGGVVKRETTAIVEANGDVSIALPSYTF